MSTDCLQAEVSEDGLLYAVGFFRNGVKVGSELFFTLMAAEVAAEDWRLGLYEIPGGEAMAKRGRPRIYATDAERKAAYRARKALRQVNVELPEDVAEALDSFVARQVDGAGLTKSQVVVKLLRQQLFRKR